MPDNPLVSTEPGRTPQFETAEYAPPAGTDVCKSCGQAIVGQYYRVNGNMACPSCADQARRSAPGDTHSGFVRALLFGAGAALLGLIGYAAFTIVTGFYIGYVSLAVGYIIAKAMMKGSHSIGGRRYQILAVLFTYAAVSLAAIPIYVHQYMKEKPKLEQPAESAAQPKSAEPAAAAGPQTSSAGTPKAAPSLAGFGRALAILLLVGLASPFLELQSPLHGIIGLVILFVGMQIAWKIAAGQPHAVVDGPF